MKTLKFLYFAIGAVLLAILALPKAIGLTVIHYLDSVPLSQFGDGPPSDLKALNEAMETAFKAMKENITKVQETATKALEEVRQEGTLHGKTNDELKKLGEIGAELAKTVEALRARTTDMEQKLLTSSHAPGTGDEVKTIGQLITESEEYKDAAKTKNAKPEMRAVDIGSFHKHREILQRKTLVINATFNNNQPLVQTQRLSGVNLPGLRRLTVRDLLPQSTTESNLIEFARELVFTNNAGPQYDASPGSTEGAIKPESGITFELDNAPVITYAHWIPASRQVLSDAGLLRGYIENRLTYGLALAEEGALLNGDGTAGSLEGLMTNATAFTYGSTNQTALDTLLKAQLQVSLSEYEVSGYVLNPIDWTNILLLKDTTGRYLFSDPHGMTAPRVWGKDVVATQSMTAGQFLAGAFAMAAEIFDREDATVRIAEQHADFFVRNLVVILAEERLALVIYRPTALVKGSLSYSG